MTFSSLVCQEQLSDRSEVLAMGVRGLMEFVFKRQDSLLQPYNLSNTTLIIDGNNICHYCTKTMPEKCSTFGGDYDFIHSYFTKVICNLLKCGIRPIVLFDGCQHESKFQTLDFRRQQKMEQLSSLRAKKLSVSFSPLFQFEVFVEVLDEMGIKYIQLYEEADREIAALAKFHNCPVLSNDSDFFIYDVDFIPAMKIDFKAKSNRDGSYFLRCRLYRYEYLSKQFQGLQRSALPLVGVLLGNDFVGTNLCGVFKCGSHDPVEGVFRRLQTGGSVESISNEILQSLEERDVEGGELAIRKSLEHYDIPIPISLSRLYAEDGMTYNVVPEIYGRVLSKIPEEILKLFEKCKLATSIISLIRYQHCCMGFQIEDINQDSSHYPSIPIIREIYKVLRILTGAPEEIIVNIRLKSKLVDMKLICSYQDYISRRLRGNVIKENRDVRCRVFCDSLCLDESDRKLLSEFDKDWTLFVTSIIYWTKNVKNVTESHLTAVLLMALCNYIKSRDRNDRRGSNETGTRSFSYVVDRVPQAEYLKFVHRCNILWGCDRKILNKKNFLPTAHVFANLQSVTYYVSQFNTLLNEPFHNLRISRLYSGTFLFTLFFIWTELGCFTKNVFEDLPNFVEAYKILETSLSRYLPAVRMRAVR